MESRRIGLIISLLTGILLAHPAGSGAATVMELYGTFHAMGVIVTLTAAEDPDQDATASLSYRVAGSGDYRQGLPLSRVSAGRFVGSIFALSPGTSCDVRITFSDPDGAPLNGVIVNGSASTRTEISLPAPARTCHVDPGGSGTTCSAASPCSLMTALNQAQGGQEVVLHGGVYYQGELSLPRSGSAGAPIVIRGFPGETAILDGADPATFTWAAQGGGVYLATVNAADPHLVMADGQRLYPYQSLADLQSLAWGVPGFFASGTALYVRLAGNADPNGRTTLVTRFNRAFTIERDFIFLADLTFRHYGLGAYGKALYFNNASDNLVQGCTFAVNDLGIGLKRNSHRNVFQDNTFYDTDFNWPWAAVKEGSALETGGIRMYEPMTGRGTVIRRNTFHDYFDGFGVCPDATAGVTNETDVYENLVYNAGDDGMETDGQCSNVRIWGNTFHDVLVGISLAPVYTGPVYAVRNLVYRTGAGNSGYPGSPFKFNSGYDPSGPIFLFHNTADAVFPGSSGLDIKSPGSWQMVFSRNNIWSGTEYAISNANPGQPLDLDHDGLYTTRAGELAWWSNLADLHLNTIEELRSAAGGIAPDSGALVWSGPNGAGSWPYNTRVVITASPDGLSTFGGWSGDCAPSGLDCTATMTGNRTVDAAFLAAPGAKIGADGYATLNAAYDSASPTGTTTILTLDTELKESLTMDKEKEIALSGGWNAAYNARTGVPTTLAGVLAIGLGSLTIDGLAIQ